MFTLLMSIMFGSMGLGLGGLFGALSEAKDTTIKTMAICGCIVGVFLGILVGALTGADNII